MIRCEPHAHTAEVSTCAHMPAAEMVRRVREAGYDLLLTTDHYYHTLFTGRSGKAYRKGITRFFEGYRRAEEAGAAIGLRVLPAMELSFVYGHGDYLTYGLTEDDLVDIGWPFDMSVGAFREAVNAHGGLLFQAHPYRPNQNLAKPDDVDGIEVLNMNPRHISQNEKALAYADMHGLLKLCGSDVHQRGDEGGAALLLPSMPADVKAFADMLRGGCAIERMR